MSVSLFETDSRLDPNFMRPQERSFRFSISYGTVGLLFSVTDILLIISANILSGIGYHLFTFQDFGDISTFFGIGCVIAALLTAILHARGSYEPSRLINEKARLSGVFLIWMMVFLFLAAMGFLLKMSEDFSRGTMLLVFVSGAACLLGTRVIGSRILRRAVATGRLRGRRAVMLYDEAEHLSGLPAGPLAAHGYEILAQFPIRANAGPESRPDDEAAIESTRDLLEYVRNGGVDDILLAMNWRDFGHVERVLFRLRAVPVPVHLLADRQMRGILSRPVSQIGTTLAVELRRAPLNWIERALKRSLDLVLASLGLLLLSPMFLIVALAIRLDSKGPVFFRQERTGFSGRTFRIFKFRSMTTQDNGSTIVQAARDDPRVTRVGAAIRSRSIDELPQLINVVLGHMSLVGPRPHALAHDDEYDKRIARYAWRQNVTPGITGWAQINGLRGATPTLDLMESRVEYDLWYINNWSLWLDLRMIVMTIVVLSRSADAY